MTIKELYLDEFINEMVKILDEKFGKYKNSWETTDIGDFRTKMDEQIKSISTIITAGIDWDKEEVKRRIIHVANYCLFIFTNLNKK